MSVEQTSCDVFLFYERVQQKTLNKWMLWNLFVSSDARSVLFNGSFKNTINNYLLVMVPDQKFKDVDGYLRHNVESETKSP